MTKPSWKMTYKKWLVYANKIVKENKKTLEKMKEEGSFSIFNA